MKPHITVWVLGLFFMGITATTVQAQDWAIKADYTESCSCNPTCPCLFGSPSTRGYCEGNNLIEITEGHYGDVDLDGVSVVTAFSLGKWLKVYVDENASVEQATAVMKLLKLEQTFGIIYSGGSKILSEERVPISVNKTETKVTFSVPASKVEIEKMEGWNGNPIKIQNLPVPFMEDHTQFKAVTLTHKSKGKEFKHTGTNGLTSKIDASGTL